MKGKAKTKKFVVAAYKDDEFAYLASGHYDTFLPAFEYCAACIRECAPRTGMRYRVENIEV